MPHEPLVYRALGGYPVVGRSPFGWLLRIDSRSSELRGSNCFNAEFSGVPNGVIPQPRAAAPRLVHRSGGNDPVSSICDAIGKDGLCPLWALSRSRADALVPRTPMPRTHREGEEVYERRKPGSLGTGIRSLGREVLRRLAQYRQSMGRGRTMFNLPR